MADRNITTRRTVQQAGHCIAEALSIIEANEDPRCACDDLRQARDLVDVALKALEPRRAYEDRPR